MNIIASLSFESITPKNASSMIEIDTPNKDLCNLGSYEVMFKQQQYMFDGSKPNFK